MVASLPQELTPGPAINPPLGQNLTPVSDAGPGNNIFAYLMRQQELQALQIAKEQRKDETIGKLVDHLLSKAK